MKKIFLILIVSPHRLFSEGMAKILTMHDVAIVQNYGEAITLLLHRQFDYALLDFALESDDSGLRLVRPLLAAKIKPIMLGGDVGIGKIRASFKLGAFGYVDARKSAEAMLSLLSSIERDESGFPAEFVRDMHFNHDYPIPPLSKTEQMALDCFYKNPTLTNLQLGNMLNKSDGRIRNAFTSIMKKFNVKRRQNLWREVELRGYFPQDE